MQAKQRLSRPVSSQEPPLVPPEPLLKSPEKQSLHFPVTRGEKSKTTFNNRVLHEQDGRHKGQREQLVTTPALLALPAQTPGLFTKQG